MLLPQSDVTVLPDALRWETVPVSAGEMVEGWIAGPIQTIGTHWVGGASKPCRFRMSGNKLPCPCQEKGYSLRVRGYLPIIDRYGKQIVVICSAMESLNVKKMPHGEAVRVIRPKIKNRPFRVIRIGEDTISSTTGHKVRSRKPVDIGEYLLHLWQDRELTEFLQVKYLPSARVLAGAEEGQISEAA